MKVHQEAMMEAMDLEANPEEMSLSQSIKKSLRKRPQWRLSEHKHRMATLGTRD
jgi:hypothetical protein